MAELKKVSALQQDILKERLSAEGIIYVWLGRELGGYRRRGLGEKSPNKAWKTLGFRNYADYTLSEEFKAGIDRLLECGEKWKTAYMCSEKYYWRCHRRIISDYLVAKGHEVTHIIEDGKTGRHKLTRFAKIADGILIYPEHNRV